MALFGAPAVQGGREESGTAGFPTSGLVALYKCDERSGDKLYDATGTLPPMVLSTGVALDAVAGDCYFDDTTGLAAAVAGQPAIGVMACEIITPAAAGSANDNYIIARATTTNSAAMSLNIAEITTTSKFRLYAIVRTIRDGATTADTSFNSSASLQLEPSTHYQIVVRVDMSAATPSATFSIRSGVAGAWSTITATGGTAGTHLFVANVGFRLLAYSTGATPWNGKIMSALCGAVDVSLENLRNLLNRPTKTYVRSILGTTKARFWDFRTGTGTSVRELCTDTEETVSGTVAWSTSLSGCTQPALRQGQPYYGKAGVKIGGETSYVPTGGGAVSAASPSMILSSETGWTFQMTGYVGSRDPASATQLLAYAFGPDSSGAAITDPADQTGAGFVLDTSQNIAARAKRFGATDASDALSAVIGGGSNVAANGLLTTYTLTCSWNGTNWIVKGYRQAIGSTTPTEISPNASWSSADFHITRANAVRIGNATLDCEAVVGFVGIWHRPITEAEMARCHTMAVCRMTGQPIYVAEATGLYGNGSENYPYNALLPAWRTMQPNQTLYIGAGEYTDRLNMASITTGPSSSDHITVIGASMATTSIVAGAGVSDFPANVTAGHWTFSGLLFDANQAANNAFTTSTSHDVEYLKFSNCHFKDALAGGSTGTGMFTRALYVEFNDCESSLNGEHGVYLRVAQPDEGWHQAVIRGLYCHDNTEDGLKFASDGATDFEAAVGWSNCIIDRVKVDGGIHQLWLSGVKDSVVTNCLLLNKSSASTATGALQLGYPIGEGATVFEDFCDNVSVANVTIYNASGAGILDSRSTNTTLQNVICSAGDDDLVRGDDGTAVLTYCAGDSNSNEIEAGTGNIIGATIAFTNAGAGDFTLTAGSDGTGDGVNLTGLSDEAEVMFDGTTARPGVGAGNWNMGAY